MYVRGLGICGLVGQLTSSSELIREHTNPNCIPLPCAHSNTGWPKARLAWWRIDWPSGTQLKNAPQSGGLQNQQTLPFRFTPLQLSSESQASAVVSSPVGDDYLISGIGNKQTIGEHVEMIRPTSLPTPQTKAKYSNDQIVKLPTNNKTADDDWLAWMGSELGDIIVKFSRSLNESDKRLSQSLLDKLELAFESGGERAQPSGANIGSQVSLADQVHFLRHNRLVLYVCGASNTRSLDDSSSRRLLGDIGHHRDKLARIRPIFSSILVRPNGKLSVCLASANWPT